MAIFRGKFTGVTALNTEYKPICHGDTPVSTVDSISDCRNQDIQAVNSISAVIDYETPID